MMPSFPTSGQEDISVLLLEDSPLDADLTLAALARGGLRASVRLAETRDQFVAALGEVPDLILADYSLPDFDGLSALDLAREALPEVPFVFVSGVMGEEVAIESLKRGATDYVIKGRLERLVPAVSRALAEARERAERRRAEAELRRTEERLRLAAMAAHFGTWEWDLPSGAIECSAVCMANLGLVAHTSLTHETFVAAIHPDDRDRVVAGLASAVARGDDYSSEHRVVWPDGSTHWILVRGRLQTGGPSPQMIGVTLDIDAQKKTEADLLEADRRKDQFLATLAHELRNPLAPLRNGLEVIRLADGDAATVRAARSMMDRQFNQLVRLVDDLLDLSRITRGRVELRKEPADLSSILRTAVETSRPVIDGSRHELTVSIPPGPLLLLADPARLAQVFSNLLNNAAKYTEPGGHIGLLVRREGDEAVVTVRDDGLGIPPELLPRVFDMFMQVDLTLERAQGGLGIGLTLVKSMVELHGGRVKASSAGSGRGSEFEVCLPLQAAPPGESTPAAVESASEGARRVLVCDDNPDVADSLGLMLRLLGNEVEIAHDGHTALEIANRFRPDAVVLDIGMPGLTGYEVADRLRRRPDTTDVMLIALTGWGQEDARKRSLQAGFDHHLAKPADPETLGRLLSSVEPRRRGPSLTRRILTA